MLNLLEIELTSKEKVITETLSRIGIADKKNKILYTTCHLKNINEKWYLCHFKELFILRDSEQSYNNITEEDILRRNSIALLLEDWKLINILGIPSGQDINTMFVFCLPYSEKGVWSIKSKINTRRL